MTQVVGSKGAELSAPLNALDALSTAARWLVDLQPRFQKLTEYGPHSVSDADKRIAELQSLKPSEPVLNELTMQIKTGLLIANPDQIRVQLALLLGAFPSSNASDPLVYSAMMLHEVRAAKPSVIALTA